MGNKDAQSKYGRALRKDGKITKKRKHLLNTFLVAAIATIAFAVSVGAVIFTGGIAAIPIVAGAATLGVTSGLLVISGIAGFGIAKILKTKKDYIRVEEQIANKKQRKKTRQSAPDPIPNSHHTQRSIDAFDTAEKDKHLVVEHERKENYQNRTTDEETKKEDRTPNSNNDEWFHPIIKSARDNSLLTAEQYAAENSNDANIDKNQETKDQEYYDDWGDSDTESRKAIDRDHPCSQDSPMEKVNSNKKRLKNKILAKSKKDKNKQKAKKMTGMILVPNPRSIPQAQYLQPHSVGRGSRPKPQAKDLSDESHKQEENSKKQIISRNSRSMPRAENLERMTSVNNLRPMPQAQYLQPHSVGRGSRPTPIAENLERMAFVNNPRPRPQAQYLQPRSLGRSSRPLSELSKSLEDRTNNASRIENARELRRNRISNTPFNRPRND